MDQEPAAYTPNHIPFGTRVFYLLVGLALLAYGSYGLWIDDIFLPAKRGPGTHMHGPAAVAMAAAMALAAVNMLSVIVDHFDQRNNETNYRLFGKVTHRLALCLLVLAFLLHVYREFAHLFGMSGP